MTVENVLRRDSRRGLTERVKLPRSALFRRLAADLVDDFPRRETRASAVKVVRDCRSRCDSRPRTKQTLYADKSRSAIVKEELSNAELSQRPTRYRF